MDTKIYTTAASTSGTVIVWQEALPAGPADIESAAAEQDAPPSGLERLHIAAHVLLYFGLAVARRPISTPPEWLAVGGLVARVCWPRQWGSCARVLRVDRVRPFEAGGV